MQNRFFGRNGNLRVFMGHQTLPPNFQLMYNRQSMHTTWFMSSFEKTLFLHHCINFDYTVVDHLHLLTTYLTPLFSPIRVTSWRKSYERKPPLLQKMHWIVCHYIVKFILRFWPLLTCSHSKGSHEFNPRIFETKSPSPKTEHYVSFSIYQQLLRKCSANNKNPNLEL